MRLLIIAFATIALLTALDRLLLAAETRGWIYYRKRRASPGTRSAAALELQALVEPGRKQVVASIREQHAEEDESGDPPTT